MSGTHARERVVSHPPRLSCRKESRLSQLCGTRRAPREGEGIIGQGSPDFQWPTGGWKTDAREGFVGVIVYWGLGMSFKGVFYGLGFGDDFGPVS